MERRPGWYVLASTASSAYAVFERPTGIADVEQPVEVLAKGSAVDVAEVRRCGDGHTWCRINQPCRGWVAVGPDDLGSLSRLDPVPLRGGRALLLLAAPQRQALGPGRAAEAAAPRPPLRAENRTENAAAPPAASGSPDLRKATERRALRRADKAKELLVHESAQELRREVERLRRELEQRERCTVCLEMPRGVCLQPCGHCCVCSSCAARLSQCPICRCAIEETLRAYLD
uniref:RING-type domain-containing protein n=1 Tax=Alexandrium catenella TaxID=2925 RepID=A0A7S1RLV6_ALECA